MALSHVGQTKNPVAAWKYLTKSATLGRSYALYAANVAYLASLGILVRSDSPGCRAICQSRGPNESHQPVSTSVPCLTRTMTALRVKVTVQLASHRVPTPIKVWHKPGIRLPLVGNSDVRWGKSKLPVPANCCVYPVFVRTVTLVAARYILTTGILAAKYM